MENLYNNKYTNINRQMPIIDNYLSLAIITTIFCCLPLGIVSLAYSIQVNTELFNNNYELAKLYSKKAKFWGILALVLGIIILGIYVSIILIASLYEPQINI